MKITTLSDLLEQYDLVASWEHNVITWNGSATYKHYWVLDSGRAIEKFAWTIYPEKSLSSTELLRWSIETGRSLAEQQKGQNAKAI